MSVSWNYLDTSNLLQAISVISDCNCSNCLEILYIIMLSFTNSVFLSLIFSWNSGLKSSYVISYFFKNFNFLCIWINKKKQFDKTFKVILSSDNTCTIFNSESLFTVLIFIHLFRTFCSWAHSYQELFNFNQNKYSWS